MTEIVHRLHRLTQIRSSNNHTFTGRGAREYDSHNMIHREGRGCPGVACVIRPFWPDKITDRGHGKLTDLTRLGP